MAPKQFITDDSSFDVRVLPTWRPDRAMAVGDAASFNAWVDRLAEVAKTSINDFDSYMAAIGSMEARGGFLIRRMAWKDSLRLCPRWGF